MVSPGGGATDSGLVVGAAAKALSDFSLWHCMSCFAWFARFLSSSWASSLRACSSSNDMGTRVWWLWETQILVCFPSWSCMREAPCNVIRSVRKGCTNCIGNYARLTTCIWRKRSNFTCLSSCWQRLIRGSSHGHASFRRKPNLLNFNDKWSRSSANTCLFIFLFSEPSAASFNKMIMTPYILLHLSERRLISRTPSMLKMGAVQRRNHPIAYAGWLLW